MFKRTKIAVATATLLGAIAAPNVSAVALDESGNATQVLIFPYYNVNNGFQTAFTIRNTKNEYKVLKMRFRESGISNDVLDFNVYMSPYDHFAVTVSKDANGDAVMHTSDTTCTYPAIPASGVKLNHTVYDETNQSDTREGYLEVIEQGLVVDGIVGSATGNNLHNGIKHVKNADGDYVPKDCSLIAKAWDTGYFTQGGALADPAAATATIPVTLTNGYYSDETVAPIDGLPNNMLAPTGGLQGYSVLLDTVNNAAFAADPVMIRNYSNTTPQHYKSDDSAYYLLPSLASGDNLDATMTDDAATATVTNTWSVVNADWGLSDPGVAPNRSVPSGVNPLPMADVLAAKALTNDYFIDPAFDGATDWVVTFPMRKHGINNGYDFDNLPKSGSHPVAKFKERPLTSADVAISSKFYNREEAIPAPGGAGFSPAVQAPNSSLTREVNIVTFVNPDNATNTVLGSDHPFFNNLESGFIHGWAEISFTGQSLEDRYATNPAVAAWTTWASVGSAIGQAKGTPVIGFAAIRGNMGAGTKAFGETLPHIFTRSR